MSRADAEAEAAAEAEAELAWQDEVAEIRKLDAVTRSNIILHLDMAVRACRVYRASGDVSRLETELFKKEQLDAATKAVRALPPGYLREALAEAFVALMDAYLLNSAYSLSNTQLLTIVERQGLEQTPRYRYVPTVMKRAEALAREAAALARRAGLNVTDW